MKSDGQQLDLYRHSPAAMAKAHRDAADAALMNPYETLADREKRARFHEEQAQALEQRA